MKKIVLPAFFFLIVVAPLHAGWVITEKVRYPDNTFYESTIYFQNNLIKTVDGDNMTIFDLNRRELTFLNLKTKTFWQGSAERYKREIKQITIDRISEELEEIPETQRKHYRELYENLIRDMDNPAPAFYTDVATRVEMTSEQRTILGYVARKYRLFVDGLLKEEIWLSSGIPVSKEVNLEKFRLFLNEISFGNMETDHRSSREYLHLVNSGYPLVSKEFTMEGEILTEVVKVERKQLTAHEFHVPQGFVETDLKELEVF
jgi:hypothetical protein